MPATRGSSRDDNLWEPSPKTAEEQHREAESSLASPGHGAEHAARLKVRTLTKLYNTPPAWRTNARARLDAAV